MEFDIRRFDELASTNSWLLDQANAGAPEGLVAVAGHQTAGRGRLGRQWLAPPGASLLVSVLVRPRHLPATHRHLLTLAMALAASEACVAAAEVNPELKWPNDLLVDGRKLAGILAEVATDGAVVVGLGVNCDWPDDLPPEIAATATALNRVAGRSVSPDSVLGALLPSFDSWVGRAGDAVIIETVRERCSTLGRRVRAELPGGQAIEGVAVEVTDLAHLVVEDAAGSRHDLDAADVVHLR